MFEKINSIFVISNDIGDFRMLTNAWHDNVLRQANTVHANLSFRFRERQSWMKSTKMEIDKDFT